MKNLIIFFKKHILNWILPLVGTLILYLLIETIIFLFPVTKSFIYPNSEDFSRGIWCTLTFIVIKNWYEKRLLKKSLTNLKNFNCVIIWKEDNYEHRSEFFEVTDSYLFLKNLTKIKNA